MLQIILTIGIPSSGKSTWAKSEIAKDPNNWVRINNDQLREMMNGSVWSADYEKIIGNVRNHLIKDAIKCGKNIIIDNLNINRRHFKDVAKICKAANADINLFEKSFYIELDEAIVRDAKREGKAKVGEEVIKKWWKESGGKQHQHYNAHVEVFTKTNSAEAPSTIVQDPSLDKCAIFDLDGTMCNISHRNPYDASNCDKDIPNEHVVELAKLLHKNGHKIFFFSGREDKHKEMTIKWLDANFSLSYVMHMRESGNFEDDRLLKERLFNTHIKDKYNCKLWVDDRLRVCKFIHEAGLPLFRVGPPDADF